MPTDQKEALAANTLATSPLPGAPVAGVSAAFSALIAGLVVRLALQLRHRPTARRPSTDPGRLRARRQALADYAV